MPERANGGTVNTEREYKSLVRAPGQAVPITIPQELEWQVPVKDLEPPHVYVTRWTGTPTHEPLEVSSDNTDLHFITYTARRTEEKYWVGTKSYTAGVILPDSIFLHSPTTQRRTAVIKSAFDFYRIYFSQEVLADCFEIANGRPADTYLCLFEPHFSDDQVVRELTRSIVDAGRDNLPLGSLYVETAGLTLAVHLIRRYFRGAKARSNGTASPLAKWRLDRVAEYIEANLSQRIGLDELSTAAGLSRAHFAAQFRSATGATPHSYIMRRKVEHSKQLLLDPNMQIADVAAIIGFASQAHFTGVFKQLVGDTPHRWRQCFVDPKFKSK